MTNKKTSLPPASKIVRLAISQAKETKPFSCTLILPFLGGDANILSKF